MSLIINGKKYNIVCLNGKEYSRGYFNGRLVLNVPDNNAYLWAGPGVRFGADDKTAVSYLNTPQVITDALSGAAIGLADFRLAFDVHKDAVETGTVYLLTLPGAVAVKSEGETLAFKFLWEKAPVWKWAPKAALTEGWNKIILQKQNARVTLSVNGTVYTLIDHSNGAPVKNKIYRGFSTQRFIQAVYAPSSCDAVFINVLAKDVRYARQTIASYYSNSDVRLCMDTSAKLFFYAGGYTYPTDYILEEGGRYWIKLFPGGGSSGYFALAVAPDDNTANLDDVVSGAAALDWTAFTNMKNTNGNYTEWRPTPYHFGGDGYNNSSSYVWRGGIDMAKLAYCQNGQIVWDGRKDAYTVTSPSDSGWSVEEWQNKPDMPDLNPGELKVTPGWMKVKDVKAVLL
uniref:Uncharacterized protein n=1 Tax=uncultured Elusimicrobia bacterium TaxID=699876 RepID=A0A650EMW2_9BACT|nr:hypothetical protein Elusimicrob1349_1210 [uncultured Elusimicrobia bacterium]